MVCTVTLRCSDANPDDSLFVLVLGDQVCSWMALTRRVDKVVFVLNHRITQEGLMLLSKSRESTADSLQFRLASHRRKQRQMSHKDLQVLKFL